MSGENNSLSLPIAVRGGKADCLTEIFRDEVNLVVWERTLSDECTAFAHRFSREAGVFERFVGVEADDSVEQILPAWALGLPGAHEGRGLVHRSPAPGTSPRLVLGLDWLS